MLPIRLYRVCTALLDAHTYSSTNNGSVLKCKVGLLKIIILGYFCHSPFHSTTLHIYQFVLSLTCVVCCYHANASSSASPPPLTTLCKATIHFRNVAVVTLSWWISSTRISQKHRIVCHLLIPSISISPWNPTDVRLLSVQPTRTNAVVVAFFPVKTCNTTGNCLGESGLKTHQS